MLWAKLKSRLRQFRDGTSGVMMVETVILLPALFFMVVTMYELFEVHRYKAARIKATYSVADMLSRESGTPAVNDAYIDNTLTFFSDLTRDNGSNQIRITVVTYNGGDEEYNVRWSEVRGEGDLTALTTDDVANEHDKLPILRPGQEMIIVESQSEYRSPFGYPGLNWDFTVNTSAFTGLRFVSQLCYEGQYCAGGAGGAGT